MMKNQQGRKISLEDYGLAIIKFHVKYIHMYVKCTMIIQ